ncbi:ExeM/NucH family extracellular endonuclease [Marinagarivorans algicola]|uniref:ExeM/NucH family extracellular endonuclease n=1 Tax=Marinagarivorans algicola TaxID=1513270 RepID=UPI00373506FB
MTATLLKGLLTTSLMAPLASAEIIITSVYDGPLTGGLPKGVELYTDTSISDLSQYGLGSANNGGGSDGEEFTFPPVALSAGEYIYIASDAEGFTTFMGFAPDYVTSAMGVNGDDAIELFKNGTVTDVYGDINKDGTGTEWDYTNGWAYRIDGAANTEFDISQWYTSGTGALDGAKNNDSAINPISLASFSSTITQPEPEPEPESLTEITLISSIQGSPANHKSNRFGETDVSPLIDTRVMVEAVVVGDFQDSDEDSQRNLGGFYLQEEDSDTDDNALTSEGLFVNSQGFDVNVNVGDKVRVTGTVSQSFGETQLSQITDITLVKSDQLSYITPAIVLLEDSRAVTIDGNGKYQPDLEAFEGMLITIPQTLTIIEQHRLDQFNEIGLTAGDRPYQFTQKNTPDAELYDLAQRQLGATRIMYDDGLNEQNANINHLDGFAEYTEASAKRMGDTVESLTGVLDYKWAGGSTSKSTWRIRAHIDGINTFSSSELGNSPNPRPLMPSQPLGNLKIASMNVLNFFTTLDDGSTKTAAGHSPRGADDLTRSQVQPASAEFERQIKKLRNAILALEADIIGLVEIENDFDPINDNSTAIEVLVNTLNAESAHAHYDYVYPGSQFVGSDAIAVAFIYNTQNIMLTPNTQTAILDDAIASTLAPFSQHDFTADPIFNGPSTNRVSLAATFTHLHSNEPITVVANHFKSKGGSGLTDTNSPNFDAKDGAGFWNDRRLKAATAVSAWLATAPTGSDTQKQVILGDLNAYAMEAPLQYLINKGFNNVEDSQAYSYVFDGQIGTLDYLLVSDALMAAMTSASVWHINADEADALDYNLDYNKQAYYFNGETATRNSDHDPVIAGFWLPSKPQYTPLKPLLQKAKYIQTIMGKGKNDLWQRFNLWQFSQLTTRIDRAVKRDNTLAACKNLITLRQRMDGKKKPSDWVKGRHRLKLLKHIKNNQKALKCRQVINFH